MLKISYHYLAALTLDSVWNIGILASGGFILESTVGPKNTTHELSNIMLILSHFQNQIITLAVGQNR